MVIYSDGPSNSGKTTVTRTLAQLVPKTVHVGVDDLRHFADCLTLDEATPCALQDATTVILLENLSQ
jgi:uridine kinase